MKILKNVFTYYEEDGLGVVIFSVFFIIAGLLLWSDQKTRTDQLMRAQITVHPSEFTELFDDEQETGLPKRDQKPVVQTN